MMRAICRAVGIFYVVGASVASAQSGPDITSQPQPASIAGGATTSFTVTATGDEPLSYQWRRRGSNIADDGRITGAATATLTISNVDIGDIGWYDVIISNAGGSVLSRPVRLGLIGNLYATGSNVCGQLGIAASYPPPAPVMIGNAIQVAAGHGFSLALKKDGTVWAWGGGGSGQLGDGTLSWHSTPIRVPGMSDVVAVAAGRMHSMALKSDGTVWTWGDNIAGQLGDGTITRRESPAQVPGLSDVVAVAAGESHSLAVKGDGSVWAWGQNFYGQLGDGTTTYRYSPVQVTDLSGVVAVAAGDGVSLAVKADGTVWGWGINDYGQLGDGTTTRRSTPVQVTGLADAVAVTAREHQSLAIKRDGTLWYWGQWNTSGAPARIPGIDGAVSVEGGRSCCFAITADGTVWAWGRNDYGQLADGTEKDRSTPVRVSALEGAVGISADRYYSDELLHAVAVKKDGTVWAWGSNWYGELGDGTRTTWGTSPMRVSDLAGVTAIAAGSSHSLAVGIDGFVHAWGNNQYGELGDGTMIERDGPVQVLDLADVTSVAAGSYHSLGVKGDATVWAWGTNYHGELGDGTTVQRNRPVQVLGLTDVAVVAAGSAHSLALKNDGTVWAWGRNANGQLGTGTADWDAHRNAAPVPGLTDAVAIAAGGNHSLAAMADGSVWAWGYNLRGQLGDDTTIDRPSPVQVTGLSDVIAVVCRDIPQPCTQDGRNRLCLGGQQFVEVGRRNEHPAYQPCPGFLCQ